MSLAEAIVRSPVKVSVGILLLALFGMVALSRMPMQLTPEVQHPTITIETLWPGASAQEVEREIVVEQEEQLKGVEGATKLSSESTDSRGSITIEFQIGTNMEEALLKVNSRLQQVPEYPEDADQPVITTANASSRPIAWFILSARRPTPEQLDAFEAEHPELAEELTPVHDAHNTGVAMLRLRRLAAKQPTFAELLPPADLDVTKLRRFAEDEIEAPFERVPGVSQSNVIGGLEDELQVVVDPEKLAARQVTLADVRRVLQMQNKDTSAGDFWEGKRRYVVRSMGQFRTPEQVEDQLLTVRDGAPVYVRDVAEVRLGFKKPDGLVRRFGESSIAINCIRETNANVLDVMDGLREVNKSLNEDVLHPRGLELTQVYDETEYIESSIALVKDNIFVGGALTMSVLMVFLHLGIRTLLFIPPIIITSWAAVYVSPYYFIVCLALILIAGFWFARGALIVGIAIPASIVGTFIIMDLAGRSFNVISLAGLAFAVGMFVDNAIVILENIQRRHELGESATTAAIRGGQEVWGAILAASLTNIAVFLPVLFVEEEAGQLFRDIALSISGALALSIIVSATLVPAFTAKLFRSHHEAIGDAHKMSARERRWVERIIAPVMAVSEAFVAAVVALNRWVQRSALRRVVTLGVMIVVPALLTWMFWPRVEYLPSGNRNLIIGILLPPPGYNVDQLMSLGETVEEGLRPYWDVDPESEEAKNLEFPAIADFFFVARGRMVFVGVRSYDDLRAGELVPLIQRVGATVPGAFAVAKQTSLFEDGLTAGRTIDVEITGPDIERLVALGGQIIGQVAQNIPNVQARPVPSLDLSSPEVHIRPKLVQGAEMEMSASDLGFAVNALVDGAYVSDYFLHGKKIDLTVMGEDKYTRSSQDIAAIPVATSLGQLVPLAALADVVLTNGPEQINHRERMRAITIEVSPPPNVALEDAMITIREKIIAPLQAGGQLAGGYRIALAGTADKLHATWEAMRFNLILALTITYLLMAALFESWLYPFVIILSVPLGAVGGVLGLAMLNWFVLQPLDVLTMLGFIILIGTVVNNPILIVHQSLNYMREECLNPTEAILESVRTRIRPILMTAVTTVLGLLPLVLFPGAGSELYRGLGAVLLGGLVVSTIFTLVLVPTLFSLTMDAKSRLTALIWGAKPVEEAIPERETIPLPLEASTR